MPISRRSLLAASAAVPWLTSCATGPYPVQSHSLPELASRLGVRAASYVTLEAGRPGETVWLHADARAAATQPARPIFQAASLTKPVVAFVALKLARQGRLDLRAPVSRYLPDGYLHRRNPFDDGDMSGDRVPASTLARIPVATLLNHSAGLPNWTGGALAPEFEPGARWQYSGEGYLMLQAVLAAVAAQDLEALVMAEAFQPLGMDHSRLRLEEGLRSQMASGTSWSGWGREHSFRTPNAAASLYTTAADYARLMAAWLADPALVGMAMADPVSVSPELGLSWGLGWGVMAAPGGPYLWQWGNNPGFRAFAIMSVASGQGFVLLANSERGMPLATALTRDLLPGALGVFRFPPLG